MFERILGQEKAKMVLSSQIKNGKIAQVYMFIGIDGIGKRSTAVEFARIMNCSINDFTKIGVGACGECISCEKIAKNIHPDIHFVDFAKQSELEKSDLEKQRILKIETIRHMKKKVLTKVYEGKWKFFIVDPAEKMNIATSNSLLKTFEDPPNNTVIILIAKHKETIPQTIISRSQIIFFQPLKVSEISSWLMSNYSMHSSEIQNLVSLSEGSIGDAEKLANEDKKSKLSLWFKLKTQNFYISDILELSKNVAGKGAALECVDSIICEAKKDFRVHPDAIAPVIELLITSKTLLLKNVNAQMVLDNLFFDLLGLMKRMKYAVMYGIS
ncbi:MAG: DNA polymerase III subunit [Endomicrobium sp.]|nr:DNA polymerase III subunit [Endomicrobium sp.]